MTDINSRASLAIAGGNKVGQIQKIFGLNGELVVKIWDNFPENFDEPLWTEINSKGVPLFVKSYKPQGTSKAVIVFEDWESEELAGELVGKDVFCELSDEGESSGDILVGWTVKDLATGKSGEVTDFDDSEMNPMLYVDFSGKECMIPFSESFISEVNSDGKVLLMNLPEGLLDL